MKMRLPVGLCILAFVFTAPLLADDANAVKSVIQSAYIDGLQNLGDQSLIEKGFHPGFVLLYERDGQLQKLPLYNWIKSYQKRKAENPNGPKEKAEIKFLSVDVFGNRAVARFEMYRNGKLIFTDAFFLIKFSEDWRIVSKISHFHGH